MGSGLSDVPVGSRLLLVAASEDGTASDQEGTLLVRNSQLQTNMNVARNSKATPVLDSRGKVVAVHASDSDAGTLSFETPVSSFFRVFFSYFFHHFLFFLWFSLFLFLSFFILQQTTHQADYIKAQLRDRAGPRWRAPRGPTRT